jgi:ubiquinone/menaquinone biosynthesis C-methylase UbiE
MAWLEATGLGRWRRKLTARVGGRALDLGCGTGRNLALLPPGAVGIDPCRESVAAARRRAPEARLVVGRAEALPFRDDAFDSVVCGLVLCSVGEPARALHEVRRALKPAGTLHLLEHVRGTHPWHARLQDAVQPAWTWFTGGCHPNRATETTLEQAGFAIDPATRRAQGVMRLLQARPRA